ncbi:hypothetical protein WMF01_15265 [Sorangium sp. So ce1667]
MAKPKRATKELSDGGTARQQRATNERSYGEASSRLEEILQAIEEGCRSHTDWKLFSFSTS